MNQSLTNRGMRIRAAALAVWAFIAGTAAMKAPSPPNLVFISPPHSPTSIPVLSVSGEAGANANSWQPANAHI